MSDLHLDDEQLSALLDGDDGDRAHVATCPACATRLEALTGARDAVAAAVVTPLPASVLDELVATAVDASPTVDPAVVPLSRSRRLRTPPPAWLVGAAAAMLALVGVAGLVRAVGGGGGDDSGSMALTADADAGRRQSSAEEESSSGGGRAAPDVTTAFAADPEAVTFDLAEQQDPAELGVLLREVGGAATLAAGKAATDEAARPTPATTAAAAPSSASAGGADASVDRAQCRAQAEERGAEALGPLLTTGRVQWRGRPAEVLVFLLRSPAEGVTRQAMVLQRPGCALLAEQRF